MCLTHTPTVECTIGDLKPGDRFCDPDGGEFLIAEGNLVVNLADGSTTCILDWIGDRYRKDVNLGRDPYGFLKAYRRLNKPVPVALVAPAAHQDMDADIDIADIV